MDCVEVCPVDCFYEGENMLVIHPDECIDCGVCEPECPAEAIKPDTEPGLEYWLELNTEYAANWPNITARRIRPPTPRNSMAMTASSRNISRRTGRRRLRCFAARRHRRATRRSVTRAARQIVIMRQHPLPCSRMREKLIFPKFLPILSCKWIGSSTSVIWRSRQEECHSPELVLQAGGEMIGRGLGSACLRPFAG